MLNKDLRTFAEIARLGSIRLAAESLHVAQSALSRRLLKLEAALGVTLFERHARGVKLTAAGEIVLRYARHSEQLVEHLQTDINALTDLRRGRVTIHAIESLVQGFLPNAVWRFNERYPGIIFDITVEGTDRIIAAVREGRTDVGLVFYAPRERDLSTVFRVKEPLTALMHPRHPLACNRPLSLAEIVEYPVAVPHANSGSRLLIEAACKAADLYFSPVLESNSMELLVRFARHGRNITFGTPRAAWDSLRAGELVALPLQDRLLNSGTIEAVRLAGRNLSQAAEEFLVFLHGELNALKRDRLAADSIAAKAASRPRKGGRTKASTEP